VTIKLSELEDAADYLTAGNLMNLDYQGKATRAVVLGAPTLVAIAKAALDLQRDRWDFRKESMDRLLSALREVSP
jgi:hypothetical protein